MLQKDFVSLEMLDTPQLLTLLEGHLRDRDITSVHELFKMLKSNEFKPKGAMAEAYRCFLRSELARQAGEMREFNSSNQVGQYLADKLANKKQEEFHLICVNNAGKAISDDILALGSSTKATVPIADTLRIALNHNANSFFVCHNHPSGNLAPSVEDMRITKRLIKASRIMQVPLLDHFIVGDGKYLSMCEQDLI